MLVIKRIGVWVWGLGSGVKFIEKAVRCLGNGVWGLLSEVWGLFGFVDRKRDLRIILENNSFVGV